MPTTANLATVIVFDNFVALYTVAVETIDRNRCRHGARSPSSRSFPAHGHSHDHAGHSHAPDNFGWAFAIGAALNTAFVIAELIFGYAANSLALISDAVHNLSDVIALLLAWGAAWLAQKRPTQRHTYGYRRASILAALFNAGLLLVAVGGIVVEAVNRLREPAPVAGWTVVWSRHSASSSTAARRCCSCAAVTATSISAAPICTWWRMRAFRSAWWSPRS